MTDPLEPMPLRPLPPSADEQRLEWRAIFARRALIVLLLAAVFLSLAICTVGIVLIRTSQTTNGALLDRINECTTPTRPCYERGRRQTGNAVANVNRVTVAAATCASRQPGQSAAQIKACVVDLLAKDAKQAKR